MESLHGFSSSYIYNSELNLVLIFSVVYPVFLQFNPQGIRSSKMEPVGQISIELYFHISSHCNTENFFSSKYVSNSINPFITSFFKKNLRAFSLRKKLDIAYLSNLLILSFCLKLFSWKRDLQSCSRCFFLPQIIIFSQNQVT